MKEIKSILGCGMVWIKKCLVENNIKIRIKNDYSNPAQDPDFAEKIRKSREVIVERVIQIMEKLVLKKQ
jgi:hypothetical protein